MSTPDGAGPALRAGGWSGLAPTRIDLSPPSGAVAAGDARFGPQSKSVALCVAIGVGAIFIRLCLHRGSFDVFGDEVIYSGIGRSVVSGGFPRFSGAPFLLHGPAFFYLEAGWSWVFGKPSSLIPWIYEMRTLNALLAGLTATVMSLLTAKISSSWKAGVVAGVLFALDPFSIRQNDRVLLETAMMFWVVLGYYLIVRLDGLPVTRRTASSAVGAGLAFGCAILTKDEAVLITILPVVVFALFRLGPRRLLLVFATGASIVPYAVWVSLVTLDGYGAGWWSAKTSGLGRLLGVIQTTGFHSSRGGSLGGRLVAESGNFVTTYVILAMAVPAVVLVLYRGSALHRMVGIFYCAAGVTLGYAVTLGTLEEQELYLLIIPTIIILPVSATLLRSRVSGARRRNPREAEARRRLYRRARAVTAGSGLAALLILNLVTCVVWYDRPDDGFSRLLPYLAKHVAPGTSIDLAAGAPPPAQADGGLYALEGAYRVGAWTTRSAIKSNKVRYIFAEWGPIDEGFAFLGPSDVHALVAGAKLVFSYNDRTYGRLALYKLSERG